ncbi:hypothetical protein [Streptomyces sp. NPDC020817]|uniref:hypothetical protein n=1 Tax=Streptomyces sp. NPDC020817 TaxID=3365095 RepID=UPI0037A1BF67
MRTWCRRRTPRRSARERPGAVHPHRNPGPGCARRGAPSQQCGHRRPVRCGPEVDRAHDRCPAAAVRGARPETFSKFQNRADRSTGVLFADGAGAVV